jgi:hypothetical protein
LQSPRIPLSIQDDQTNLACFAVASLAYLDFVVAKVTHPAAVLEVVLLFADSNQTVIAAVVVVVVVVVEGRIHDLEGDLLAIGPETEDPIVAQDDLQLAQVADA